MKDDQQFRNTLIALSRDTVLRFNLDGDSKGDSDVRVLDKRLVRAGKDHVGKCFPCLGDIHKNDLHRVERGLMDGKVGNCRTCSYCCIAIGSEDDDQIEFRYTLGRNRADQRRGLKGTSSG